MPFTPPSPQALRIQGPTGALETKLEDPGTSPATRFGIVCHPHPVYGGTMDNKVVHTLARAMQELGAPTLRFNFRGAGASEGTFDDGRGEVDDLLAVARFARERWPYAELWLAGFSFGAWVALQAEHRLSPAKLVTVAPPVGRFVSGTVDTPQAPWLLIQGDADEVVASAKVLAWAAALAPGPELAVLTGAGHFFHGRLHELKDTVLRFLAG
ncbi:MAG: alpha/beta hydrolase [Steroidobacteraceae bacterium]